MHLKIELLKNKKLLTKYLERDLRASILMTIQIGISHVTNLKITRIMNTLISSKPMKMLKNIAVEINSQECKLKSTLHKNNKLKSNRGKNILNKKSIKSISVNNSTLIQTHFKAKKVITNLK